MRKTEWKLKGHTFTLCLNAAALTDIYDRFGTEKDIPDLYRGSDKASFDALCWLLWKLSEQGELVRRWEGLDRRPIVPESYFRVNMTPFDALDARRALSAVYEQAFRREHDEDDEEEEVDLILQELQKKNENLALLLRQAGTQRLHLSLRETMILTPGELLDLLALEARRVPRERSWE